MTSDSIRARPMIAMVRMAPAAPGLRAIPSQAADAAFPCAKAPAAAAIAIANAAPITPHFTPVPAAGAAAVSWANAGIAASATEVARPTIFFFDIDWISFLKTTKSVLFVRHRERDVEGRKNEEDERLQGGAHEAHDHHRPGSEDRRHREERTGRHVLAADVADQ